MKSTLVNEKNIYFLDFTFNPDLRTLQQGEQIVQLRKKQSDVLALFCKKHPYPVSQDEFLAEVWEGGYVTSQSIAQMIRSLRISLGDEKKNIIVTIPKLGYQLAAKPFFQEAKVHCEDFSQVNSEIGHTACFTQSIISVDPVGDMTMLPYAAPEILPERRLFHLRTWVLSAIAVLCFSLICVVWGVQGN